MSKCLQTYVSHVEPSEGPEFPEDLGRPRMDDFQIQAFDKRSSERPVTVQTSIYTNLGGSEVPSRNQYDIDMP